MSATPWRPFWVECSIDGEPQVGSMIPKDAFDALLAVAKAAKDLLTPPLHDDRGVATVYIPERLDATVRALDATHPDWREWTP